MKDRASKLDPHAERLSAWFRDEHLTLDAARTRLREQHGVSVSSQRLSSWWEREQSRQMHLAVVGRVASGAQLANELTAQFGKNPPPELETIMKLLRVVVLQLSAQAGSDPATLDLVSRLMRPLIEAVKLQQAAASLELDRQRFQRETCELFLRWQADAKARQIADGDSSRAEKIEALGQLMFGDTW